MRDAAPFIRNPDASILSIAAIEIRIEQRQRNIRRLATSCRQDIKSRITSWPALLAAGVFGFVIGRQGDQSFPNPKVATVPTLLGRLQRALTIAAGLFKALPKLPL